MSAFWQIMSAFPGHLPIGIDLRAMARSAPKSALEDRLRSKALPEAAPLLVQTALLSGCNRMLHRLVPEPVEIHQEAAVQRPCRDFEPTPSSRCLWRTLDL